MDIDIDLVNSLKVGEFIKVSETEVLACLEWTKCEDCYFNYQEYCDNIKCDKSNRPYLIYKLKQL